MIHGRLRSLLHDIQGATIVEFAFVAPVLLLMVMGIFDLGHNMYTSAMLQGSVQQAARDSTIEGAAGNTAALDQIVTDAVRAVSPAATLQFDRKAYSSFSDVSRPEDFTDVDGNGTCDAGEPFEDINGNGTWDSDRGLVGQGGARDAVLYTVRITYPRVFPIARLIPGQSDTFTIETKTVLRNQPYGVQNGAGVSTGNC